MGLLDKLRGELVDIIEWIDDGRHTLVWRFPRYHNQIKHGAQLIVRPGQLAVFVREGKLADVFGPGQHRLETRNLPVLSTLAGWTYGFDSPFKAEVYFVSTRQITDLKWGTPTPVLMRDPDFGPLRVRALRHLHAARARSEAAARAARRHRRRASRPTRSASWCARSSPPPSPIWSRSPRSRCSTSSKNYAVALGSPARPGRERASTTSTGSRSRSSYIVNVSVPAEVEQALDARTSMNVIGDLAAYQAYQLGALDAGRGGEPGRRPRGRGRRRRHGHGDRVAAAARRFARRAADAAAAACAGLVDRRSAASRKAPSRRRSSRARGRLRPDTLVWTAGMADWQPAAQVAALAALLPPPRR